MNKKWIIIVVIVGMAGWAVFDFVMSADTEKSTTESVKEADESGLKAGEYAPDFELETMDGEVVKLSDYKGQKVLLNFWATWCPPCRAEMPDMQKYHDNHEEGVILAVNLIDTEQSVESIEKFLEEYEITFTILADEKSKITQVYEAYGLPTSYFIDTEGKIHKQAVGAVKYDMLVKEFKKMK